MASTIVTKNSSTASAVPVSGDLTQGELAVNVTDKRLFTKNSGGTVVELGTNPASLALPNGTANGVAYLNGSKVLTTGSALTFDGTRLFVGTTAVTTSSSQSGEVYSTGTVGFLFTNTTAGNFPLSVKNEGTSGTRNLINFFEGTAGGVARANISFDGSNNLAITPVNSLIFGASSAEQMRLTSTGLGIGTSSPAAKLHVNGSGIFDMNGTGGSLSIYSYNALVGQIRTPSSTQIAYNVISGGNHAWLNNNNEQMRLDSSGNLGLGVTPSAWRSIEKAVQVNNAAFTGVSNAAKVAANYYVNSSNQPIYIANGGAGYYLANENVHSWGVAPSGTAGNAITFTQAMTLDASGNLLVGATSGVTTEKLNVTQTADGPGVIAVCSNATLSASGIFYARAARNTTNNSFYALSYYNTGAGAFKWIVADSGNVTNTNGSYGTISDVKMKTGIVDAGSQWDDIKAIRFRKFKMKDDPDQVVQLGVVAQEIEITSPGLVEEHKDTDEEGNDLGTTTKSVKTSVLLMKAAVALQEAMARIEQLEAKVAALKGN